MTIRPRLSVIFAALMFACACSPASTDLQRLYARQSAAENQPPLILVHGIFGAKLESVDTGEEVWPAAFQKKDPPPPQMLAINIDPERVRAAYPRLQATELAPRAAGIALDARILEVLEQAGQYVRAEAGKPPPSNGTPYYVFPYDWRQDNIRAVRKLDDFIRQVQQDHGDPNLRVDFVAHGMGGLVVRYYMRYGTVDVLDDNDFPVSNAGAANVRRVVLLAVPNLGTLEALKAALTGFPIGEGEISVEIMATVPSIYQLFPHPISSPVLSIDGQELKEDIFDVEVWRRLQWSIFHPDVRDRVVQRFATAEAGERYLRLLEEYVHKHLERGRRFVWSLTVKADEPPGRYVLFGGACELTPAKIVMEESGGRPVIRWLPKQIDRPTPGVDYERLMLQPGDGDITKSSLLARHVLDPSVPRHKYSYFPLGFAVFLCAEHDTITANTDFQNNLLHALLTADSQQERSSRE